MTEFAWVQARFECSLKVGLKKLEVGARADVAAMVAIAQQTGRPDTYELAAYPDRFTVIREKLSSVMSVNFSIDKGEIVASLGDESACSIVRGIPTLNRDGDCVLLVKDSEWELWHFRRAALDQLFFKNF